MGTGTLVKIEDTDARLKYSVQLYASQKIELLVKFVSKCKPHIFFCEQ